MFDVPWWESVLPFTVATVSVPAAPSIGPEAIGFSFAAETWRIWPDARHDNAS